MNPIKLTPQETETLRTLILERLAALPDSEYKTELERIYSILLGDEVPCASQ